MGCIGLRNDDTEADDAAAAIVVMACGQAVSSAAPNDDQPLTLRLGYFLNLTHAPRARRHEEGLLPLRLKRRHDRNPHVQRRR